MPLTERSGRIARRLFLTRVGLGCRGRRPRRAAVPKLELLLGDTQSKPDIGRAEAERVVNQGAQLLMGSFDSGSTAPMVPAAQQRHVPFMMDIAAADPITTNVAKAVKDGQQKVQYVYRNFPPAGRRSGRRPCSTSESGASR
jgi:hypothetical protein